MECCTEEFKKFHKKIFFPVIVIFAVLLLVLAGYFFVGTLNKIKQGKNISANNTITVNATGEIYVKSDLALATFSVINEAKTVGSAMQENTENMNAVVDFVKGTGAEDRDLKTTNFNIYPRYEWKNSLPYPYYQEGERVLVGYEKGERVLVGYEIRQSLEVKIRDLAKIGEIIQGATESGANQVGELQFTVDDQEKVKNQARALAIEKAKEKAKDLSEQLDVKLVKIKSFDESSVAPRYYLEKSMTVGMGGGEDFAMPQIETGENKIEVSVYITYEIK